MKTHLLLTFLLISSSTSLSCDREYSESTLNAQSYIDKTELNLSVCKQLNEIKLSCSLNRLEADNLIDSYSKVYSNKSIKIGNSTTIATPSEWWDGRKVIIKYDKNIAIIEKIDEETDMEELAEPLDHVLGDAYKKVRLTGKDTVSSCEDAGLIPSIPLLRCRVFISADRQNVFLNGIIFLLPATSKTAATRGKFIWFRGNTDCGIDALVFGRGYPLFDPVKFWHLPSKETP